MTKTRGPSNRKQRIVYIIPDVKDLEALDFDPRLPDPQIVFGGMVQEANIGLSLPNAPAGPTLRAVYHAVFLVPLHLVNLPEVQDIKRGRPNVDVIEVLDDVSAEA